ncbi:MAG: serine/threonine-protein kinase [Ktedonobacteraceae bacterium]
MIKMNAFDKLVGVTLGTYRIEQFLGQSDVGPNFLVRTDATSTYLLRFLVGSTSLASQDQSVYLERFQYQASQIAALRHPYILPLLDFGVYRDVPYLISPHIPLRSLRTRIDKNGALNTFTVGRYLDQVATALEYAHEHSVLHGNLSVDSIFIRMDGNVVAADFGMKSLLNLPENQHPEWSDGLAPEQLLGKPASPASDVYALGSVVYHLLTGHPVFKGHTLNEIGQQHLYTTIPPLSLRNDLPTGLYGILAHALAKNPVQRYHQPGAFANDYHHTVLPTNRTRMPFVVSEAPSVQANAPSVTGTPLAEMQFIENAKSKNRLAFPDQSSKPPHSLHGFSFNVPLSQTSSSQPGFIPRMQNRHRQRFILIASLVILLVLATSTIGITLFSQKGNAMVNVSGQVTFFSNQNDAGGQTNALTISIQHLAAPAAGNDYEAWIINAQNEEVTGLGKLMEKGLAWSLTYQGLNINLLNVGSTLEITQEQGVVNAPTGKAILVGTFPDKAFQHIQHLLVSYPATPGKVGLLIGAVQQTHLLDGQAALLQNVATSQNTNAIACITQSMLNIIEGTQGAHYQPLAATCIQQNVTVSGDGYGLLGKGYLAGAVEHASLALSQPDATTVMRQHAALMDIALTNITGWVTTIEQDVLHLHAHPIGVSSIQQITILADNAYHGVDTNGDGQIDPVAGEAGAITAYQQGQLMATLSLVPNI